MAEQVTLPGDEGHEPETAVGDQPSGHPSEAPLGWIPPPGYVPPGMAGPGGPQSHSLRGVWILIAVAAVVVLAGGISLGVALSRGSSGQHFPGRLLGLARDTSLGAQRAAGHISSGLGVFKGIIVRPGAAIYGAGPHDGLLVLTAQWSGAAKAAGLSSHTLGQARGGLESVGVTDATLFPAGPHGGSLACGHKAIDGKPDVVCAWADGKMFGVAFYFGSASSLSDGAAKTIQVRSAVEQ